MALQQSGLDLVAENAGQFISDLGRAEGATDSFLGELGGAERAAGGFSGAMGTATSAALAFGSAAVAGGVAAVGAALFEASEQAAAIRGALGQDLGAEQIAEVAGAAGLLESRFGVDLQGQLGAVRQLIANGLAPDAAAAMDILTAGFERGLNVGDDLLDTLTEYSPNFAALGISGDEALGIINRGLEAGARNSDVIGDAVKEFGILLREPATLEAVAGLDEGLGGIVQQFQSGQIAGDEALTLITERLGQIEDPIERNAAGIALFGTLYEDMGEKAILALGQTDEGLIASAGAADAAAGRIASLGEIFPRIWDAATTALIPVNDAILDFINTVIGAEDPIAAVGAKLQEFGAQAIAAIQEALPGWQAGLGEMAGRLGTWVQEGLPVMLGQLADARTQLVSWVLDSLPEWGANLAQLGGQLGQWVVDSLPELGTNLGEVTALLITKTGEFIAETGPKLLELGGRFVLWVAEEVLPKLPGQLASIATALITGIGNFLAEIGPPLLDVATAFLEWVATEVLPALPGKMAEIGGAIVTGITTFATEVVSEASGLGGDLIAGMVQGVQDAASSLYNAVAGVVKRALGAGEEEAETGSPSRLFARELGQPISQGIALGVAAAAGLVDTAVGETITGGLDAAEQQAPAIGQATGAGFARGIEQSVAVVSKAAQKLAGAATSGAKKELGIASPSQVFADEVGAPVVAGMAQGMISNLDVLLDAAEEISWAVLEEAKGFAKTIEDAVAPLFAAAFQGAADFARGQISALDALDALQPDADRLNRIGEEGAKILEELNKVGTEFADRRAELEREIAEAEAGISRENADALREQLEEELRLLEQGDKSTEAAEDLAKRRAALAWTAANNLDPEKRRQAEEELKQLDEEEPEGGGQTPEELARIAAIKAELARLDEAGAAEDAAARQAELDRIARLKAELAGLADAEAQRRAQLKAEADDNVRRYQEEAKRFEEQQRIADQAQADIAAAQAEALTIEDPAERAAYLRLRTQQIIEAAKLEQRIAGETNEIERARLEERRKLLETAQQNEFLLYQQEAKARQAAQAAALRDAEQAAKILGDLIYFSQADVFGAGQDAIRGVAKGMLSQLDMLSKTLGGVLDGALAAARRQLGINSPSRVAAALIGEPFVDGISQAVLAGRAALADASATAVGGLTMAGGATVTGPAAPSYAYSSTSAPTTNITLDLRGVSAGDVGAIEAAVARGLAAAGIRADSLARMA